MGFATGLKKIQEATAPKSNGEGFANRLKVDDGQQILFRIINEFDEDSKEYDEERGLAGVVEQHQSPSAWYKKAQCTMDEYGKCYACERSKHYWSIKDEKNAKAWRAKSGRLFESLRCAATRCRSEEVAICFNNDAACALPRCPKSPAIRRLSMAG